MLPTRVFHRLWVEKVEQAPGEAANVFRTWNYPIKEMYKIIWEQMSRNDGFLDTPADGIKRVYMYLFFSSQYSEKKLRCAKIVLRF